MKLPALRGIIRRRILVNFRVDPGVIQRQLPSTLPRGNNSPGAGTRFRPKQVGDAAMAGLCLIRLEQMRPPFIPMPWGGRSENAAHRIAVCWSDEHGRLRDGVYIPCRHTDSLLNHLAGARLFPGEAELAHFDVRDEAGVIDFTMHSHDNRTAIRLRARETSAFPSTSRFASLDEASAFLRAGSVGYSAARGGRLDGMSLGTDEWRVEPLEVELLFSSFFSDETVFPRGSVEFDSALIMRTIPHAWHTEPDLCLAPEEPCLHGSPGLKGSQPDNLAEASRSLGECRA